MSRPTRHRVFTRRTILAVCEVIAAHERGRRDHEAASILADLLDVLDAEGFTLARETRRRARRFLAGGAT